MEATYPYAINNQRKARNVPSRGVRVLVLYGIRGLLINNESKAWIKDLPRLPHIQNLWRKALMMTGQAWVSIMQKSDRARFTTNMLDGVRRGFTWTIRDPEDTDLM